MLATSVYIAREQFLRHQTVEHTQARSEVFHIRVVRALLHTRVFMKFKLSCTAPEQFEPVWKRCVVAIEQACGRLCREKKKRVA